MEKRLNKKLETFMLEFKENISKKAGELQTQHQHKENLSTSKENSNMNMSDPVLTSLIQYIYDYPRITFTKEDIEKRKRAKNIVPLCDRCIAKRAANVQCTRKKKQGQDYCGTHMKGTPHGLITDENDENSEVDDSENPMVNLNFEEQVNVNVQSNDTSSKSNVNKTKKDKKECVKVEVWAQDIQGIMHYIDKVGNVYNAEDVIRNKPNPGIIARYSKIGDKYTFVAI